MAARGARLGTTRSAEPACSLAACLPATDRVPMNIMNNSPATVAGSPTQIGSKIVSGFIPVRWPEVIASADKPGDDEVY